MRFRRVLGNEVVIRADFPDPLFPFPGYDRYQGTYSLSIRGNTPKHDLQIVVAPTVFGDAVGNATHQITVGEGIRSFTFSGLVAGVVGSPFGQNLSDGDPITGTLTYDAGVLGVTLGADVTRFDQGIAGGVTAVVGGRVYSTDNYTVIVENDRGGTGLDGYNVHTSTGFNPNGDLFENGDPVDGTMSVNALDLTGSLLSSQSLVDLDPTLFNSGFQLIQDGSNFFSATIDLVTAVGAAAVTFSVTGITDPIIGGASSDVTVTARDGLGNVATGYRRTVAFTSSDGSATLPANYTFVSGDAGVHTFTGGVTLGTVGEQTVTASDVAVGTITGSQTAITVEAAPAGTNFSDDFEAGFGLWSADNGIWGVGLPTSGPNECHSGVQCAGTVLDGNYAFNTSSLVSPTITLPAIGATQELHLRFWHWFSLGSATGGNPDRGVVYIQEWISAGVWSASTELTRYELTSGGWSFPLVDLSAYGGKTVRILFSMQGNHSFNSGRGWYVDDVSIAVN